MRIPRHWICRAVILAAAICLVVITGAEGIVVPPSSAKPLAGLATVLSSGTPRRATEESSHLALPMVARTFRPQVSMLGVALEGYKSTAGFEQALQLGVHWVRRWDPISWRDVEPTEGIYRWEVLAGLEDELWRARASNVEPVISIQYTPQWAQKVVPYTCGPIRPDKLEAFARFMEQVVARYGSSSPFGVRYWQVGNEPDVAPGEVGPNSIYGCWGDPHDPYYGGGYYAEMLRVVYPRVKRVDPQAQILLAGLLLECDPAATSPGHGCINEQRWRSGFFLEGVMRAGGGEYFDIANLHSYAELRLDLPSRMHSYYAWSGPSGGTGLPEKVAFVRRVMGQYGYAGKPVFSGEVALKCEEPSPECYDVGAAFVPRAYAEAYGLNLVGAIYYALISEFKYKGLLLPDFTPKPAFWSYAFFSSQLAGADYVGPVMGYDGVTGYTFSQNSGIRVQILWSSDGNDRLITLPEGFIMAFDKFGTPLTPTGSYLTVGWSPIYLQIRQSQPSRYRPARIWRAQ